MAKREEVGRGGYCARMRDAHVCTCVAYPPQVYELELGRSLDFQASRVRVPSLPIPSLSPLSYLRQISALPIA